MPKVIIQYLYYSAIMPGCLPRKKNKRCHKTKNGIVTESTVTYAQELDRIANAAKIAKSKQKEEMLIELADSEIERIKRYIDEGGLVRYAEEGKKDCIWHLIGQINDNRSLLNTIVGRWDDYKGIALEVDFNTLYLSWGNEY